jgi:hypothetical protein
VVATIMMPASPSFSLLGVFTLALSASLSGTVDAQSTRVNVIGWDLGESTGVLELIDEERVSIRLEDGATRMFSPGDVAFIEFPAQATAGGEMNRPVPNGLLWLVDGTRYTGWSDVEDGRFVWRNWWSGTVKPELDDILAIVENRGSEPDPASTEDVILLRNGDRLEGLIAAIGEDVEVEREDGTVSSVPMNRVQSIALVNDLEVGTGTRAWLAPGDEVAIDSYRFDPGTGFRIPGREPLMPAQIEVIAFDSSALLPLASVDSRTRGLDEFPRYFVPTPREATGNWPLDAPTLEFMGPLRVDWTLPRTGMKFKARVVLPRSARKHGRLEIVLLDGDQPVWSTRLDGDRSSAEIGIPLETDRLSMEIRESGAGPIQNVVRLERALLVDHR